MSRKQRCLTIVLIVTLLAPAGCKKEGNTTTGGNSQGTISAENIAAVRDALTRGMREIAVGDLKTTDVGRKCVVSARIPEGGLQLNPPPPPPSMLRLMGQTVICNGELDQVSEDSVTVRAAYPTAGNYKRVKIPRGDIQSLHLAK